ncbi:MAG: hypothetical protein Tsb0015_11590 [Simkaniaceae bacterium]
MSKSHSISNSPVEINNLPQEVHNNYAQISEFYDPKYITETEKIPMQTEISVLDSAYPSHFDTLFELHKKTSFVSIPAPEGYFTQSKRFFKQHILPNVDPETVLKNFSEKLDSIKLSFQGQKRSKAVITDLLEVIIDLEKLLKEIYSSMYRYNKG